MQYPVLTLKLICHLQVDRYLDLVGDEREDAEDVSYDGHHASIHPVDQDVLIQ